jgi:hypothetical protein
MVGIMAIGNGPPPIDWREVDPNGCWPGPGVISSPHVNNAQIARTFNNCELLGKAQSHRAIDGVHGHRFVRSDVEQLRQRSIIDRRSLTANQRLSIDNEQALLAVQLAPKPIHRATPKQRPMLNVSTSMKKKTY